ncbi:hypothetical protein [Pandoraea fibrosis]|uniref:hypothetical protein n=1 Tax=Pandoraea fibrosis TaxID=1891094 RepID=UPI001240FEA2|nr:hypothetical protein [Pandoraea fibrosis]
MNVLFWCKREEERRYARAMPDFFRCLIFLNVLSDEAQSAARYCTLVVPRGQSMSEVRASGRGRHVEKR